MSTTNNGKEDQKPSPLLLNSSNKQPHQPSNQISESQEQSLNKSNNTSQQQSSQKVQQLLNLFKSTEPQSRSYRQTIEEIISSFTMMDSLTNKLQEKVDIMLNNQKLQFIESYKLHMSKVKEQFQQIDKRIQSYEQKISYYENQGQMSHLVIKVNKLEEQCKKLYKDLGQKQKIVRDNELTIKVQKSQIKRYQKQLKLLMRQKNQLLAKVQFLNKQKQINSKSMNSSLSQQQNNTNGMQENEHSLLQQRSSTNGQQLINSLNSTNQLLVFPTQLQHISINHKINGNSVKDKSKQKSSIVLLNKRSQQSLTLDLQNQHNSSNHQISSNNLNLLSPSQHSMVEHHLIKTKQNQLKRQISHLKKKNQLLTSYQSHILQSNTSMESFFIDCVNEIKQQIKIKKKINYQLTFEQWKKQDKIQLLIKVLSNDQVLVYLYQRLFRKKKALKNKEIQCSSQQKSINASQNNIIDSRKKGIKSLYQISVQKHNMNHKVQQLESKQKLLGLMKDKNYDMKERKQKTLSVAKKRISKHISENSLLPKIHFHLEY